MDIFSVFDSKAEAFLPPFFSPNRAVAIRSFTRAVQQEGSDFNLYAGDYTLFCIGSWDPVKGKLVPAVKADNLGVAVQFLAVESEPQMAALTEVK